jgi:hypothetical protein
LWQEAGVPLSSKGERMIEHRVRMAISLALAVMIGACQGPEQAREGAASQSSDSGEGAEAAPIRAGAPADAIRAYYAAIDAGDFAKAYRLWAREGQASGQSYAEFRQGFAATRSTQVTITGLVTSEGAAGSIYATVPVEVNAVLRDGTRQRFVGQYVLRRVNDVPGAREEQLNWHIESASLEPG